MLLQVYDLLLRVFALRHIASDVAHGIHDLHAPIFQGARQSQQGAALRIFGHKAAAQVGNLVRQQHIGAEEPLLLDLCEDLAGLGEDLRGLPVRGVELLGPDRGDDTPAGLDKKPSLLIFVRAQRKDVQASLQHVPGSLLGLPDDGGPQRHHQAPLHVFGLRQCRAPLLRPLGAGRLGLLVPRTAGAGPRWQSGLRPLRCELHKVRSAEGWSRHGLILLLVEPNRR
mmetsp:Transcript_119345/g.283317  ORF Transcript_119345/g.283317 Transcript_119345/m.283317 type:complete len:226 (-) Transcript_119345:282-959(-)